MVPPLATLTALTARLDRELDTDEQRLALAALDDASRWARHYGAAWPDPQTAPPLVETIVLAAVRRHLTNPEGHVQSRAGDETVAWGEDAAEASMTVAFTLDEIATLRILAGRADRPGVISVPLTAWGPMRASARRRLRGEPGYVPAENGTDFPLYPSPDSPW
ncbi:hypothetical protein Afil01_62120 [Actinorhabdospora filicis]|uniref:Head-to-tail adaptor n=1 Tax=Actinorhabdospora filicis TaxID=1785913 RepID=A0A9W6SSZ8_9ACTN|nr:hypothetical protein [Actinorhabdospora filicis]GLZ81405.1 hypothetical protein Afil01_62120 [Actinorhabdospora filicis]